MPSRSGKKKKSPSSVEALDARLAQAGVVRKRRLNTSPRVRAPQSERFSPDELRLPPPVPIRAANGVEWLPVPGWDLPWLYAGFSTRKGGLSRAYCADDVAGEPAVAGNSTSASPRPTTARSSRAIAASSPRPSHPIPKPR